VPQAARPEGVALTKFKIEHRCWNPLSGLFALWLGAAWIVFRAGSVMVPLVAISLAPIFVSQHLWGETGFGVALAVSGVVVLPFWLLLAFKFFFPASCDLMGLPGFFLQRVARLTPQDTLAAVDSRWESLNEDGRRWWRCWIARS
jgi:hypothetical protein